MNSPAARFLRQTDSRVARFLSGSKMGATLPSPVAGLGACNRYTFVAPILNSTYGLTD